MIRCAGWFSSGPRGRKKPKRQLESTVRDEVMDYLDRRKDCYAFVVRNTAPYVSGRFVRPPKGFKRGISDIICISDWGKTYFIECKGPKTKMSIFQKTFRTQIELLNHPTMAETYIYILARSLEDVKGVIG